MPQPLAAAADIEAKIAKILGHEAVKVKPYGRHFLIQIDDNGELKWSFKGYHLQTGEPKKTPGRKADAATTRRRS